MFFVIFQDLIVMKDAFDILLPKVSVDSDDSDIFKIYSIITVMVKVSLTYKQIVIISFILSTTSFSK